MGMFDDVRCEVPLPDGHSGRGLQTKDFDCTMSTITITKDGRLFGGEREAWWDDRKPPRDLEFHGEFNFYDYVSHKDGRSEWHSYLARFTDGQLVRITLASDSDGNPEGGDGTAPSQGDDSADPKGIAQ